MDGNLLRRPCGLFNKSASRFREDTARILTSQLITFVNIQMKPWDLVLPNQSPLANIVSKDNMSYVLFWMKLDHSHCLKSSGRSHPYGGFVCETLFLGPASRPYSLKVRRHSSFGRGRSRSWIGRWGPRGALGLLEDFGGTGSNQEHPPLNRIKQNVASEVV